MCCKDGCDVLDASPGDDGAVNTVDTFCLPLITSQLNNDYYHGAVERDCTCEKEGVAGWQFPSTETTVQLSGSKGVNNRTGNKMQHSA